MLKAMDMHNGMGHVSGSDLEQARHPRDMVLDACQQALKNFNERSSIRTG